MFVKKYSAKKDQNNPSIATGEKIRKSKKIVMLSSTPPSSPRMSSSEPPADPRVASRSAVTSSPIRHPAPGLANTSSDASFEFMEPIYRELFADYGAKPSFYEIVRGEMPPTDRVSESPADAGKPISPPKKRIAEEEPDDPPKRKRAKLDGLRSLSEAGKKISRRVRSVSRSPEKKMPKPADSTASPKRETPGNSEISRDRDD